MHTLANIDKYCGCTRMMMFLMTMTMTMSQPKVLSFSFFDNDGLKMM